MPPRNCPPFAYGKGGVNARVHVARRHRAVFVEVPKAGCTKVKGLLQLNEMPPGQEWERSMVHDRKRSPLGAPFRDGFDLAELMAGPDWFRFSFVRNPYSRALSCYLEKIAGEQYLRDMRLPKLGFEPTDDVSFVDFLRRVAEQQPRQMDAHWAPQAHLLSPRRVDYDFFGRFEYFQADVSRIAERLGLDVPEGYMEIRTAHTTNAGSRLAEYYDDTSVRLVREIYRDDFKLLGYGFDLGLA